MATVTRRKLPDLIEDAIAQAPRYEFFQLVRLLEEGWRGHGRVGRGLDSWLQMRPASEISFPAADVRRCRQLDDGRLDLQLNFMGLYGVDTVLPQYFAELIARDDDTSEALRAFLDIFSHRFYALFYHAWMKFRPHIGLHREEAEFPGYLAGLSGMQGLEAAEADLAYCGVLGARVRGGAGLGNMLESFLGGHRVQVRQFVPRWVSVGQAGELGAAGERGVRLGHSAMLGEEVLDVGGKIELHVGPIGARQALELLPGSERAGELARLVRRYLEPTLRFDVVIQVLPEDTAGLCLGSREACLGRSSWLGEHVDQPYALRISDTGYRGAERTGQVSELEEAIRQVA